MTGTRWVREEAITKRIESMKDAVDLAQHANLPSVAEFCQNLINVFEKLLSEAEPEPRVALEARLDALKSFKKAHDLGWQPPMGQFDGFHDYADVGSNYSENLLDKTIADLERSLAALPKEEA